MDKIITIGRQFGSGGWEVGNRLSMALGIPFYDKEIIDLAAQESGISKDLFEDFEEKPTNSLLYSLSLSAYPFSPAGVAPQIPISDRIFFAQADIIKDKANQGPCVIVGRCADYILRERNDVLNVFIYGDMNLRVRRIMERENLSEDKALEKIKKYDKRRASYHNYYADNKWGDMASYDVCINSNIGIVNVVEMLKAAIK
ncbi:MAG: cytidylate kinase-like family protein [Oscillospiraceae bacterium]|nr:cytidylate kinase-like family protein [Oscillospiraceae bacterium]